VSTGVKQVWRGANALVVDELAVRHRLLALAVVLAVERAGNARCARRIRRGCVCRGGGSSLHRCRLAPARALHGALLVAQVIALLLTLRLGLGL